MNKVTVEGPSGSQVIPVVSFLEYLSNRATLLGNRLADSTLTPKQIRLIQGSHNEISLLLHDIKNEIK
jgi:hypothetical protein